MQKTNTEKQLKTVKLVTTNGDIWSLSLWINPTLKITLRPQRKSYKQSWFVKLFLFFSSYDHFEVIPAVLHNVESNSHCRYSSVLLVALDISQMIELNFRDESKHNQRFLTNLASEASKRCKKSQEKLKFTPAPNWRCVKRIKKTCLFIRQQLFQLIAASRWTLSINDGDILTSSFEACEKFPHGFGPFCIRCRLLAKASCFFLSISAAEHFPAIWLVTKTGRQGRTG